MRRVVDMADQTKKNKVYDVSLHTFSEILDEVMPTTTEIAQNLALLGFEDAAIVLDEKNWARLSIDDKYHPFNSGLSLSMTQHDKFQCFLIGCHYLLAGVTNLISNDVDFEKFCLNLQKFDNNGSMMSLMDTIENQIKVHWNELESLLLINTNNSQNNKHDNDNNTVITGGAATASDAQRFFSIVTRLAMFLFANSDQASNLSFVEEYLDAGLLEENKVNETVKQRSMSLSSDDGTNGMYYGGIGIGSGGSGGKGHGVGMSIDVGEWEMNKRFSISSIMSPTGAPMSHASQIPSLSGIDELELAITSSLSIGDDYDDIKESLNKTVNSNANTSSTRLAREDDVVTLKNVVDEHLKEIVMRIGCFMDIFYSISKQKSKKNKISDNNRNNGNVAIKFISYFSEFGNSMSNGGNYFLLINKDPKSGKTLFDIAGEIQDQSLIALLQQYWKIASMAGDSDNKSGNDSVAVKDASPETTAVADIISDTMLNYSGYIYETFQNANLKLSLVCNVTSLSVFFLCLRFFLFFCFFVFSGAILIFIKEEAKNLFEILFQKENFTKESNRHDFVSKMMHLIKYRRIVSNKIMNQSDEITNQLPNNSVNNYTIIETLLDSNESQQVVKNNLSIMYDEITSITLSNSNNEITMDRNQDEKEEDGTTGAKNTFEDKFIDYFGRKFVTDEHETYDSGNSSSHSSNNNSSTKPDICNFVSILALQACVFWSISMDSVKWFYIANQDSNAMGDAAASKNSVANKYKEMGLIDLCIVDDYGQSLHHIAALFGDNEILNVLLGLDNNILKYKTPLGKTALDTAMEKGNWSIVKDISLSNKNSKIKNLAKHTEEIVTSSRGIADHILKEFGVDLMESIIKRMISLISRELPISDHLLLACWQYEAKIKNKALKDNRIWQVISERLNIIFSNSSNKRQWYWFELYVWKSSIWYEFEDLRKRKAKLDELEANTANIGKVPCECGASLALVTPRDAYHSLTGRASCNLCRRGFENLDLMYHCPRGHTKAHRHGYDLCGQCSQLHQIVIAQAESKEAKESKESKESKDQMNSQSETMYNHLTNIVNGALVEQRETLRNRIDELKESQPDSFNAMINYKEYLVNDREALSVGLRQDNEKLLTFPNKLKFMNGNSIAKNMQNLTKYKLKDFYDSRIYLSSLIVVAKSLNDIFQQSMKRLIQNNNDISSNCVFKSGPVKDISRAQAKSESDYGLKLFPNSSHVLDFIRCTLVYSDCQSMMNGIKAIRRIIEEGNKNGMSQTGCIKRLLRVKNMYLQSKKHSNGTDDWLYRYQDIKMNVLVEHNGASMIAEIQVLICFALLCFVLLCFVVCFVWEWS